MDQDRMGTTSTGNSGSFGTGSMRTDADFGIGGNGTGQAAEVKSKVKEVAMSARERATERLEERVDAQKGRATHQLTDLSRSLRMASDNLPGDNGVGRYMELAASQVDNLASFLDNADVAELVDDVEAFARRQPAAFLGGAFALGILGARFLKSSRRNLRDDRFDAYGGYDRGSQRGGFRDPYNSFSDGGRGDGFRGGSSGFGDGGFSDSRGYTSSEGMGRDGQRDDFR